MPVLSNVMWKVIGGAAGAVAASAARAMLSGAWRKARHEEPPENPASPATSWPQALSWAAVSGVGLGVARLVAQRGAAAAWKQRTGELPAAVESSGAAAS